MNRILALLTIFLLVPQTSYATTVTFRYNQKYAYAMSSSPSGTGTSGRWATVDASTGTNWKSNTNMTSGMYMKIDLGENKSVDEYRLQASSGTDYPLSYTLDYSTDDSSWNTAVTVSGTGDGDDTSTFSSHSARYWRVILTASKSNWWQISEFTLNASSSRVQPFGWYSSAKDSQLIEGQPGNNKGGNTSIEACRYNGSSGDNKSLVFYFDISAIPSTATVNSAVLSIYFSATRNGTNSKNLSAARLNRTWGEGTKTGTDGSAASAGDVTWNSSVHSTTTWTTGGALSETADKEALEVTVSSLGAATSAYVDFTITTMAQYWVTNPSSNYGVLIYESSPSTSAGTKEFVTKEATPVEQHPKLVIDYTEAGGAARRIILVS